MNGTFVSRKPITLEFQNNTCYSSDITFLCCGIACNHVLFVFRLRTILTSLKYQFIQIYPISILNKIK